MLDIMDLLIKSRNKKVLSVFFVVLWEEGGIDILIFLKRTFEKKF